MSHQRHIIKKQILELRINSLKYYAPQTPFQLQTHISQLYRKKIIPLIDDYCNQLSSPELVYRIDKLEIDVGEIDISELDTIFIERVSEELYKQLGKVVDYLESSQDPTLHSSTDDPVTSSTSTNQKHGSVQQPQHPQLVSASPSNNPTNSRIHGLNAASKSATRSELLTYFMETGHLPWWAETLSSHELEEVLNDLVAHSPDVARAILLNACRNTRHLQRLIYQFSDSALLKLVELLATAASSFISNYISDLHAIWETSQMVKDLASQQYRLEQWQPIFFSLSTNPQGLTEKRWLFQVFLLHLAKHSKITDRALITNLTTGVTSLQNQKYRFKSQLPEIITELNQTISDLTLRSHVNPDNNQIPSQTEEQLAMLFHELQQIYLEPTISRELKQPVQSLIATVSQLLTQSKNSPHQPSSDLESQINLLQQRLDSLKDEIETHAATQGTNFAPTIQREVSLTENVHLGETESSIANPFGDTGNSFTESDQIYIQNAGLILLWPFLNQFFGQLRLVDDGHFVSPEAAQRSLLLLQYLVDCSTSTSEYNLPLNKILCGVDILEPVVTRFTLLEQEQIDCEMLLSSVIQHWSALRNTSITGFQQAFLQRAGILSIRNRTWLLQVEQKTYDILLAQLPWTIRVVKLPWMQGALHVEWSE